MPASASSGMRHNVMNKNRKTPGNAGDEGRKTPIFLSLSLFESLIGEPIKKLLLECVLVLSKATLVPTYSIGARKGLVE